MRKSTVITLVVVALLSAGAWLALSKPWSSDLGMVEDFSKRFMEDLKFRDFRSSSLYSHPLDQDRLDIGRALEKLFLVKPEMLDLMDYRIRRAELDSSGERASVIVSSRFKVLNRDKEPQEKELKLYWIRRHPDCPLGGTCPADGLCADESGRTMSKTELNSRAGSDKGDPRGKADATVDETSGEHWACDPAKERAWFMNIDSTLEEKSYRRDTSAKP